MRTVIIGNSAAAVGCIEGLRALDSEREIVVLSREKEHVYGRPLISYLLMGKTDRARMLYRPKTFYEEQRVALRLGMEPRAVMMKHCHGVDLPHIVYGISRAELSGSI